MNLLLIIPAHNEADNLITLIPNIIEACPQYDYVIINDGSTDNTETMCKERGYNYITLPVNLGIGGAVQTGYRYACELGADIAVQVDGDGQHDIGYLDEVVKPILNDQADIVIGSRFIETVKTSGNFKSTRMRRAGIHWLSGIIKFLTGKRIYDVTSGYRAANKRYISYFAENYSVDYPEPEAIVAAVENGARIEEVPVIMHERTEGKSSIGLGSSIYYMIKVTLALFVSRLSFGFRR